jgi:K+-transporting ATPase ATPase A chain
MAFARMAILIPSIGLAGSLAYKKKATPTVGTLSTDTFLFAGLLIAIILIVGALTFFPALSLGPIVEQLLMMGERAF